MMLTDFARGIVSETYTDDALLEERGFKGAWARLLLQVPADQRKNVMCEVTSRSTRTFSGYIYTTRNWDEVLQEVLAENGWL